jgi:chromosome partitioning protein
LIVALLNQKGGVGKTTLSVHLATALAQRGSRVLLVDADPQHSALDWQEARQAEPLIPVVGLPTKDLYRQIRQHVPNYDHIIIDGPPRVNELARAAIIASDLVLIPITPSPYDVWAANEIVTLLNEARVYKEVNAAFVISRKIVGTAIGRDVAGALADYSIPVLTAGVSQRVGFAESAALGSTVLEIEPKGQAAAEINALTDEVLAL